MEKYLIQELGQEKYDWLKSQGQFRIYSFNDLCKGGIDNDKKALRIILQDNQTIDNIILVDDDEYNLAVGEAVHIPVRLQDMLNLVSYLLGLFMTYFEEPEHQVKTIRQFVRQFGGRKQKGTIFQLHLDFISKCTSKGFLEIQKVKPESVLYVSHCY